MIVSYEFIGFKKLIGVTVIEKCLMSEISLVLDGNNISRFASRLAAALLLPHRFL